MREAADLREAFDAIGRAQAGNDLSALRHLYAEDFRGHSIRGEVEDRAQVLSAFGPGGVQGYRMDAEEIAAEADGNVGWVTGCGTVSGRWGETAFFHRLRFLEVYRWRDGRWQCYRAQGTEILPK